VKGGVVVQTEVNVFSVTICAVFTVICLDALAWQPGPKLTEYVITDVPAAGLNFPAETPLPLYTPPAGDPPVNVIRPALEHTGEKGERVTFGAEATFTVAVPETVPAHVASFMLTSEYVFVEVGAACNIYGLVVMPETVEFTLPSLYVNEYGGVPVKFTSMFAVLPGQIVVEPDKTAEGSAHIS
jgi:hypothetical protein